MKVDATMVKPAESTVETPAAAVPAAPAAVAKGKQVSATIPQALYEALEDYRWSQRLSFTDLVRTAVEEYATNHQVPGVPAAEDAAKA